MRTLILHASAGNGHRRAAEALAAAFGEAGHGAGVTAVRDILDFTPALFRHTYAKGYLRVVRRVPELWGYMYARADRKAQVPWRQKVRSTFNRINTPGFLQFLEAFAPDAVVCTHFMPLELLASRTRRRSASTPVFGVVTDFAVHSLWSVRDVSAYYVATEEAKRQLVRKGQREERVVVTGIPLDPVFAKRTPADAARRALGVKSGIPTVLVVGVQPVLELMNAFRTQPVPCQLLVVTGADAEVRRAAEKAARSLRMWVHVYGYADNLDAMMDAADFVIGKPGGLTSSELLAKGRPLLIVDPIPGQEQRNCEYLLENGAALRLFEIEDAPWKIRELVESPGKLKAMQCAAAGLGQPRSAAAVVEDIVRRSSTTVARRPERPSRRSRARRIMRKAGGM
jgi:processive 1,2-diacylglycerol beta-glucosyltransferase